MSMTRRQLTLVNLRLPPDLLYDLRSLAIAEDSSEVHPFHQTSGSSQFDISYLRRA